MCDVVKYPKLAGKIAEKGLSYKKVGDDNGMGGQSFSRRMRGEVDFDLAEVIWLCNYLECGFYDIF